MSTSAALLGDACCACRLHSAAGNGPYQQISGHQLEVQQVLACPLRLQHDAVELCPCVGTMVDAWLLYRMVGVGSSCPVQ